MEMIRRSFVVGLWVVAAWRIIYIYEDTVLPYDRSRSYDRSRLEGGFKVGPSYKSWSDYLLEITPSIVFALVIAGILHYCVNWIFSGLKRSED